MANNETYNLKVMFTDILNNKKIELDLATINTVIREDLLIYLEGLHQNIKDVILRMFVVYIRSWPGWGKSADFFDGKITTDEWFKRFKEYLNFKLKYIIKNGYRDNLEIVSKENNVTPQKSITDGKKSENSTQTDPSTQKEFAPFTVLIKCYPDLINTMLFTKSASNEDNLVLLSHPSSPMEKISIKQLVNWPYVEIHFDSPQLKFSRRNVSSYKRYISLTSCPLKHDSEEFLDEIDFFDKTDTTRTCYSYRFLECYFTKYVETLRHICAVYKLMPWQFVEYVYLYFKEFLQDIKELNINNGTMATNTKITFNMGKSTYVRVKMSSKKKSKGNPEPKSNQIGYVEFITPKVEIALKHFFAVQEPNHPEITFSRLNELKKMTTPEFLPIVQSAVPKVTFRCGFCQVDLDCLDALYQHFQMFHKAEQNVICFRCKMSIPVPVASENRWDHKCTVRDASSTDSNVPKK